MGTVALASGNTFTIDPYGDGLISLGIDDEIARDVYDVATGKAVFDLVSNSGTLSANGGTVAMTATTARQAVNSVVNNTGVVEARPVGVRGGKIILGGATAASKPAEAPIQVVKVSGALDVTGMGETYSLGQEITGGRIEVTGEAIVARNAHIDASGRNGGGTVLIGGDYLGGNIDAQDALALGVQKEDTDVATATYVTLYEDVVIRADATEAGDGGTVIVWSNNTTVTAAEISARGGTSSGDGGFIETSGKQHLSALRAANASAINGEVGTWLMDPVDMRVVNGLEQFLNRTPNQFLGQMMINGVLVNIFADFFTPVDQYNLVANPAGGFTQVPVHNSSSVIDKATIETALNSGTSVFITNTASLGNDTGTISIEASINKTAGGDAVLGFNSVDDITIANGVDITSSAGRLILTFVSMQGQIRGSSIGTIDVNGGIVLFAAKEGVTLTSLGSIPGAIQIDVQNYSSTSGRYELSFAGGDHVNFRHDANTVTFATDAIKISSAQTGLQFIMNHNAELADGAVDISNQSSILWLFIDPASTLSANSGSLANNVAEVNTDGVIAAGSQAGVGGALNVNPTIEVNANLVPVTQCAGITCVPVNMPAAEVEQGVLDPYLHLTTQELAAMDYLGIKRNDEKSPFLDALLYPDWTGERYEIEEAYRISRLGVDYRAINAVSENANYAMLAWLAYSDAEQQGAYAPEGWKEVESFTRKSFAGDMDAVLFEGPSGEHVLSFRGTDEDADIPYLSKLSGEWVLQNGSVLIPGVPASEPWEAAKLAVELSARYPNLKFVGHSLGGRLANLASGITGNDAIIFNASPLSVADRALLLLAVKANLMPNPSSGATALFRSPNDPLSTSAFLRSEISVRNCAACGHEMADLALAMQDVKESFPQ